MTITHELAHQWFGNLVSPVWWKYLWLSEGTSTYLKFYITDKVPIDCVIKIHLHETHIFIFFMRPISSVFQGKTIDGLYGGGECARHAACRFFSFRRTYSHKYH